MRMPKLTHITAKHSAASHHVLHIQRLSSAAKLDPEGMGSYIRLLIKLGEARLPHGWMRYRCLNFHVSNKVEPTRGNESKSRALLGCQEPLKAWYTSASQILFWFLVLVGIQSW